MEIRKIPKDLKYHKEHEWARVEGETVVVGITDYAQQQLTDIVFVELPEIGRTLDQMETLCAVESVKSVSDVFSPVSGAVIEVNNALSEKPELINEDPYGKGWITKIKCANLKELDKLMSAEEYAKYTVNN